MSAAQLIRIQQIAAFESQVVRIKGWVDRRRLGGRVAFVEIRDGSGSLQAVFSGEVLLEQFADELRQLSREAAVEVWGLVRRDDRASSGFELEGQGLRVLQQAQEWPLTQDRTEATRIDARHLYLRSRRMRATLRLRALVSDTIRRSLNAMHFVCVDSPIFTPNVVEERGTLFDAPNASTISYLTQSGQLYNEAAAMSLGRVYSFGPVFRAERSPTHRHLSEFWMVEPELAFAGLEEFISVAEALINALIDVLVGEGRRDLEALQRDVAALEICRGTFERMDYAEAIRRVQEAGGSIAFGDDLDAEAERLLTQNLDRPIWVTNFPAPLKSFYMKRDPKDPERTISADLLAPRGVGEILGGGEREEDYATLLKSLREHGIDETPFQWYLDLRKFGSVPHSGFGLGLERTLVWLLGLDHIDEAIAFPRLPDRSAP